MSVRVIVRSILVLLAIVLVGSMFVDCLCDTVWGVCYQLGRFSEFYGDKLRGSLFAGFLTLGGFLMSLKTFIVVNMKKEVFDSAVYKEVYQKAKSRGLKGDLYDPLKNLTDVLFVTIVFCIVTALFQLTIGLTAYFPAVVMCLAFAFCSIGLLAWALFLIRSNLLYLFEHING